MSAVVTNEHGKNGPKSPKKPKGKKIEVEDEQGIDLERRLAFENDKDLAAACASNGISEKKFIKKADKIKNLEFILTGIVSVKFLSPFLNAIEELHLVGHPTLQSLNGIEVCTELKRLWICETGIISTKELGHCLKLQKLILDENHLTTVELPGLVDLTELSVRSNQLTHTRGIEGFTNLHTLNIAGNQIARFDITICKLKALQSLDISGNLFVTLQDIDPLKHMQSIQALMMSSADHALSPFCLTPSFQTLVHYTMPWLSRLDNYDVKRAVLMKRLATDLNRTKLFGQMRMRSIEHRYFLDCKVTMQAVSQSYTAMARDTALLHVALARSRSHSRVSTHSLSHSRSRSTTDSSTDSLTESHLSLQPPSQSPSHSTSHSPSPPPSSPPPSSSAPPPPSSVSLAIKPQSSSTNTEDSESQDSHRLQEWVETCESILSEMHAQQQRTRDTRLAINYAYYQLCVQLERLTVETVGAHRYDLNDVKHNCKQHCNADDAEGTTTTATTTTTTTTTNAFAHTGANDNDNTDNNNNANNNKDDDADHNDNDGNVGDDGGDGDDDDGWSAWCSKFVRQSRSQHMLGVGELDVGHVVRVHNKTLSKIYDTARIAKMDPLLPPPTPTHTSHGWRDVDVVNKSTRQQTERKKKHRQRDLHATEQLLFVVLNVANDGEAVEKIIQILSGNRNRHDRNDGRNRNTLPESESETNNYLQLTTNIDVACAMVSIKPKQQQQQPPQPQQQQEQHDQLSLVLVMRACIGKDCPVVSANTNITKDAYPGVQMVCEEINRDTTTPLIPLGTTSGTRVHQHKLYHLLDDHLAVPEFIIQVDWTSKISVRDLSQACVTDISSIRSNLARCGPADTPLYREMSKNSNLESISMLSLKGCGLKSITNLRSMPNLTSLDVSLNSLTNMDCFHGSALETLDASFNEITCCIGVSKIPKLSTLSLRCNKLSNAQLICVVVASLPSLTTLDLSGNQINMCHTSTELKDLLCVHNGLLSNVQVDDVTTPLRLRNQKGFVVSVATELPASIRSCDWIATILTSTNSTNSTDLGDVKALKHKTDSDVTAIACVGREGQEVATSASLSALTSLRWAVFEDTGLSSLTEIESFGASLQELSLRSNLFETISFLRFAPKLTRLDLSFNRITSLVDIACLQNLRELCLDNNLVRSLDGLQHLQQLEQLYIANNLIARERELLRLRPLGDLKVLCMSGNVVCTTEPDLKSFVVFHLRQLCVLNSVSITDDDVQTADQIWEGTLSLDTLLDKYGGGENGGNAGEEQLQGLKIVDLADANFKSIRSLTRSYCTLKHLVSVNFAGNNLTSFGAMRALPQLKVLCLDRNKIRRVGTSDGRLFSSLRVLHLADNELTTLTQLELHKWCPQLSSLFLQHNNLSTTAGLQNMPQLKHLVLDSNRIKLIEPNTISTCASLVELHLASNRLTSLDGLETVAKLKRLYLTSNKITTLVDSQSLPAMCSLVEITVDHNPCSRHPMYRNELLLSVSTLEVIDGFVITHLERERAYALLYAEEGDDLVNSFANGVNKTRGFFS